MRLVQGMYSNARSRVRVGEGYSEEFEVKVGVHQGSVLSPLLFIIVLEALSREYRCGVPWEDLLRAASSCLEGGPLLWIWPLYLQVNKKSDDDADDEGVGVHFYLKINTI